MEPFADLDSPLFDRDGAAFWATPNKWPPRGITRDGTAYVFLADAVHAFGLAFFGAEWTTEETVTSFLNQPDLLLQARFRLVQKMMSEAASSGNLVTTVMPLLGGKIQPLDRWLTVDSVNAARFAHCRLDPDNLYTAFVADARFRWLRRLVGGLGALGSRFLRLLRIDDARLGWIYVAEASLKETIADYLEADGSPPRSCKYVNRGELRTSPGWQAWDDDAPLAQDQEAEPSEAPPQAGLEREPNDPVDAPIAQDQEPAGVPRRGRPPLPDIASTKAREALNGGFMPKFKIDLAREAKRLVDESGSGETFDPETLAGSVKFAAIWSEGKSRQPRENPPNTPD